MNKKLLIIGAGGHGKVVAETALQSGYGILPVFVTIPFRPEPS